MLKVEAEAAVAVCPPRHRHQMAHGVHAHHGVAARGEVPRLRVFHLKAALRQQGGNVSCQVQALEQPFMNWLPPFLPPPDARVG